MSAHAYSEPYSYDRRHARKLLRSNAPTSAPRKSADVVALIPREFNRDKNIELVYPKYKGVLSGVALLVIVGLHFATLVYFYFKPELPITQAEIPPMTVELYRPPVEVPPPPPKEELPPPPPKVEKPKPVEKPKEKIAEPVPVPVVEKVIEAPPPPPAPPPITPATANPGYLRNPAPEYPEQAVERGWEGTVILNVHVLGNGKPDSVEIKTSSGRKVLDTAAIQTVKRWSFVPAKQGETPVDSWVEVPIDFKLSNS
jgi:protein TonB